MLKTARKMLKRASVLGLAWHLWGDDRYAARGRAELLAVAAFEDWNPHHFLDTAEMAAAVSIGPTGMAFNFGNSETEPNRVPLAWLSDRIDRPIVPLADWVTHLTP